MTKFVLALACAAVLLFALDRARAAEPEARAKTGEAAKPEAGGGDEAGKPDEGATEENEEGEEASNEGGLVPLAELVKDGFVIRTTDFIPADGQGFVGCRNCHIAEVDFDRGMLLYAEGLCG
jgi:hypothetical protein